MASATVLSLLEAIGGAGLSVWVGGGWGIDALLGEQTRPHRDLDLMHRSEEEDRLTALLGSLGYAETLDRRPVRFVVTGTGGRDVDLHPLRFGEDGAAEQSSFDPEPFRYPADAFTTGTIGTVAVRCLSAAQQVHFHQGYEPTERDRADMACLREAFGVETHF
ncbi:nucleotidyltransferase domain-containing protein [Glycomyces paridis]